MLGIGFMRPELGYANELAPTLYYMMNDRVVLDFGHEEDPFSYCGGQVLRPEAYGGQWVDYGTEEVRAPPSKVVRFYLVHD